VDAISEERADILPGGAARDETILDHPLAEGLADDRPAVVDSDLVT
jgi:hypothetical protein